MLLGRDVKVLPAAGGDQGTQPQNSFHRWAWTAGSLIRRSHTYPGQQRGQQGERLAADELVGVSQAGGQARDVRVHQHCVLHRHVCERHHDVVAHLQDTPICSRCRFTAYPNTCLRYARAKACCRMDNARARGIGLYMSGRERTDLSFRG